MDVQGNGKSRVELQGRRRYRQMILESFQKAFWQSFELYKKRVTEQFSNMDIGELTMESPLGNEKESIGYNEEDLEEGEVLASLP